MRKQTVMLALCLALMMTVTACAPNYTPFYVTGRVEVMAEARKQQEGDHYRQKFVEQRAQFERNLDAFYVNSMKKAHENGVLTPEGVAYLDQKEAELRAAFDANEKAALDKLRINLKWYDDVIESQELIRTSILESELETAKTFEELSSELSALALQFAESAAARRAEKIEETAGQPAEDPVEPSTEAPEVTAPNQ